MSTNDLKTQRAIETPGTSIRTYTKKAGKMNSREEVESQDIQTSQVATKRKVFNNSTNPQAEIKKSSEAHTYHIPSMCSTLPLFTGVSST